MIDVVKEGNEIINSISVGLKEDLFTNIHDVYQYVADSIKSKVMRGILQGSFKDEEEISDFIVKLLDEVVSIFGEKYLASYVYILKLIDEEYLYDQFENWVNSEVDYAI